MNLFLMLNLTTNVSGQIRLEFSLLLAISKPLFQGIEILFLPQRLTKDEL